MWRDLDDEMTHGCLLEVIPLLNNEELCSVCTNSLTSLEVRKLRPEGSAETKTNQPRLEVPGFDTPSIVRTSTLFYAALVSE